MSRGFETGLRALHARGRATWPDIEVDHDAFAAFVGVREAANDLDDLDAGDMYLCAACTLGDPGAIQQLDKHYISALRPTLVRLAGAACADEVMQIVRVRFLVGETNQPPLVRSYDGTTRLITWLRVIAVRIALGLYRKQQRETTMDEVDLALDAPDPELSLLARRYGAEFRLAFRSGFESLSARERNLLRHQVIDGLGIDRVAALYGVHRTTAARWLARARAQLTRRVRRELQARLQIGRDELDSVLRLLVGKLEVSLRLFATPS
jgi:RNA polymerase sigma-70 factor (ECF subfamily)